VVTVAVGKEAREVARISMPFLADYCICYGYDLKVITQTGDHLIPEWTRFEAMALLDDYDIVVYIDNDVIVKHGSPPITDYLPEDGWDIAAFDSGQYPYMHGRARREYQERAEFLGVECPPNDGSEYLNAGVCAFAKTMRDYAPRETLQGYRDQTALAFDWLCGNIKWHKLPRELNWGHLNKSGNTKAALERDDIHFVHWTGVAYEHGRARQMRDFVKRHGEKTKVEL
jgi:hypothetical protein